MSSTRLRAEDDPLLAFLRRINGNVMRPVEHKPAAIEAEAQDGTLERQHAEANRQDDVPPPRPNADE